ncbi:MAG: hypothetical protein WKF75_00460 [Singulisphaera sp.]
MNELIARQRFNLNRGVRLARRKPADKGPSEDPFKIAGFEETLVGLTREFTEGIEGIVGERVEPLHQAEEAMLAAVEALDRGRNADAPQPMSEALRHLVSARRTIQVLIAENGNASERIRQFDRYQTQKIRKDKNKNDEAEEIADRLEELAKEEDFVYATLSADSEPGDQPARAEDGAKGKGGEKGDGTNAESSEDPKCGGERGRKGEPGDKEPAAKNDPREVAAKQEKIVDELRAIEEKLKRLEEASELAKARMSKAGEEAEKASNALRGGTGKRRPGGQGGGAGCSTSWPGRSRVRWRARSPTSWRWPATSPPTWPKARPTWRGCPTPPLVVGRAPRAARADRREGDRVKPIASIDSAKPPGRWRSGSTGPASAPRERRPVVSARWSRKTRWPRSPSAWTGSAS